MRHTAGPGCIVRVLSSLPGITQADQEAEPQGQATLPTRCGFCCPVGADLQVSSTQPQTQDSVGALPVSALGSQGTQTVALRSHSTGACSTPGTGTTARLAPHAHSSHGSC